MKIVEVKTRYTPIAGGIHYALIPKLKLQASSTAGEEFAVDAVGRKVFMGAPFYAKHIDKGLWKLTQEEA